jgi:hypothetical protein
LAVTAQRPIARGYTLAFWPTFVAARRLLEADVVGSPARATSSMIASQVSLPQRGWMYERARAGGGVVANLSSHLLFVLRACFGMPTRVRATWRHVHSTVEDELRATLEMPGCPVVEFESSWCVPGHPVSRTVLTIEGPNGSLRVDNETLVLDLHEPRAGLCAGVMTIRDAELPQPARFSLNGEAYALEDAHFLRWVTGGPAPPITAEAGLDVQRIMTTLSPPQAPGVRRRWSRREAARMKLATWQPPGRLIDLDTAGPSRGLEPAAAAGIVAGALARQPAALLVRSSPRALAIRAAVGRDVPVVAVLPDLARLLRDVAEQGTPRAVLDRLSGGGLSAWWRVGSATLRYLRHVARQDLTGIVPVLVELERARLDGASVHGVALEAPLTDLLLAAGHIQCLTHFLDFVRGRMGRPAGFETLNLGHLLRRLAACGTVSDFVIGPLNPRGHHMKPSGKAVRKMVRAASMPVLASEVSAGGTVSLTRGIAHARAHGAAAVVLSLDDLAAAAADPR